MNTIKQYLQAMEELLSDRSRWTRGAMARDVSRQPVDAKSPDAVCWCLQGAATKVAGGTGSWPDLMLAIQRQTYMYPPSFNDMAEHPEVIAALRKAVAAT